MLERDQSVIIQFEGLMVFLHWLGLEVLHEVGPNVLLVGLHVCLETTAETFLHWNRCTQDIVEFVSVEAFLLLDDGRLGTNRVQS